MTKRRKLAGVPALFGAPGRWSDRERCWRWKISPLTVRAFQTPTGQWWISGSVNSFPVASRPHVTVQRAISELEQHLAALHRSLGKLLAKVTP